jgi:putative NIF3 family GTP cyclohydrolase 1 type 2
MRVKTVLKAPVVRYADAGLPIRRVAVLGGSGGDDVCAARAAGADAYVTGELKYHAMTDAPEEGMTLIEAGHYHTEAPVCEALRQWLLAMDPTLVVDRFESYGILSI